MSRGVVYIIRLKNISKTYGGGKVLAVDNLNLTVPPGEIFGFLGPNGAGKTTTIKIMTGILAPDTGEVELSGIDLLKEPLKAKRKFGYVPDTSEIFPRLSGLEFLNFVADVYEVPAKLREERIRPLLKLFSLEGAINDRIGSYSHGMKQKLLVIASLVHDPDIWILDEPMTGLDPESSFNLKKLMQDYAARGKTVFFSTHILEVAEKLCTTLGIIKKGKLIFTGTMDELKAQKQEDKSLEELFLELVRS